MSRLPTAERRAQLAEAALRLLADKGVAGLTAKNLGASVGISDAAVFKHFANKAAIVDAAIARFAELLVDENLPREGPALDRLGAFFIARVNRVRAHPEILGLAFSNRLEAAAGEEGAERVRGIMGRSVAHVRRCLREAQREGVIRKTASPELLGWMVLGVLRAAATRRTGRASPERIWGELAATLSF
jgi:AcrR family transcriptional regulator